MFGPRGGGAGGEAIDESFEVDEVEEDDEDEDEVDDDEELDDDDDVLGCLGGVRGPVIGWTELREKRKEVELGRF